MTMTNLYYSIYLDGCLNVVRWFIVAVRADRCAIEAWCQFCSLCRVFSKWLNKTISFLISKSVKEISVARVIFQNLKFILISCYTFTHVEIILGFLALLSVSHFFAGDVTLKWHACFQSLKIPTCNQHG